LTGSIKDLCNSSKSEKFPIPNSQFPIPNSQFPIPNSQFEVKYYFDNQDKMLSQVFYLLRSRADGKYLSANPNPDSAVSYLLMFREDYDALSYLNAHAADVADRFGVESIPGSSVKKLLERWGFNGVGVVQDPLVPNIEFLLTNN
jgi:hypothetical protein